MGPALFALAFAPRTTPFSPHFNYQKENLYLCYPDIRTQAITNIYLITGKKIEVHSEQSPHSILGQLASLDKKEEQERMERKGEETETGSTNTPISLPRLALRRRTSRILQQYSANRPFLKLEPKCSLSVFNSKCFE